MAAKGILYMIPCPISDATEVGDVTPAANGRIIDTLDYFIVENVRSARRFLARAKIARRIDDLEFVELNEHTRKEQVAAMIDPIERGTLRRGDIRGRHARGSGSGSIGRGRVPQAGNTCRAACWTLVHIVGAGGFGP